MKKIIAALLMLAFVLGCQSKKPKRPSYGKGKAGDGPGDSSQPGGGPGGQIPAMGEESPAGLNLVWKRYRAFESGISQGLGLKREETCMELGKHSCIDKAHLTVLGGNEPYDLGQYERAQNPTVLTAVAVDRVVLNACTKRLELDRADAGKALVFKHFPLGGSAPTADQLKLLGGELYRRILARDPEAKELEAIASFASQGMSAEKVALMLCYAIGSSAENVFL